MGDADEFRKQADRARQMAAASLEQDDKAFWLRLADNWLKLAQEADQKPVSRFNLLQTPGSRDAGK